MTQHLLDSQTRTKLIGSKRYEISDFVQREAKLLQVADELQRGHALQ